ncbi:MAG: peptidylprolyl isomerase [Cetobacterium sp.]
MKKVKLNAKIVTKRGEINLVLFPEVAPVTVLNFAHLAMREYYNGIKFHRVLEDFMIQGGDPTGTGAGGPGYNFIDEFEEGVVFDKKGILAMANAGANTNGSQFFITHVETPWLNYKHTIFGEVVSEADQKVVDAVRQGDVIERIEITGEVEEFLKNAENAEFISDMDEILDSQFPNLVQY